MPTAGVTIRTVLFVLLPFVLPPLAFDLTVGETIVVALLLLWLAAAAAVLASIIVDGNDQVALRAIDRRLVRLTERRDDGAGETLLAIGGQLDVLTDRIEELAASVVPRPPATGPATPRSRQPSSRPWRPAEGADPRAADPRAADPRAADPWTADPRRGSPVTGAPRSVFSTVPRSRCARRGRLHTSERTVQVIGHRSSVSAGRGRPV